MFVRRLWSHELKLRVDQEMLITVSHICPEGNKWKRFWKTNRFLLQMDEKWQFDKKEKKTLNKLRFRLRLRQEVLLFHYVVHF